MRDRRWVLELGVVLAVVASALWGLDEPVISLPAVLRSAAWGIGIFSADVYVPGCPPPPESLLDGLLLLQDQFAHFRTTGKRAEPTAKID